MPRKKLRIFLDSKSLSEYLNCEISDIYRFVKKENLPFLKKKNGRLEFTLEEVNRWIRKKEIAEEEAV